MTRSTFLGGGAETTLPSRVALAVCQAGQTPVEAYIGIKQAYLGSFG